MLSRPAVVAGLATAILSLIGSAAAQLPPIDPSTAECFSSNIGELVFTNSSVQWNSHGACTTQCGYHNAKVMALNEFTCYCGNLLPEASSKLPNVRCGQHCPGFPADACGNASPRLFSVIQLKSGAGSVSNSDSSSSSSSHPTHAILHVQPTTVRSIIVIGSTIVQTVGSPSTSQPDAFSSSPSSSSSSSSSSGTNKAGIAAGVVVGIVALAAVVGGTYLYLRQRRRKSLEKAHRRQTSINAFAAAQAKAPHMSSLPVADSRLDPIIAARRQSDGSIADNQDYSRRVLKVTNPDDRW